jgi:quinol monooxygenase YgiN
MIVLAARYRASNGNADEVLAALQEMKAIVETSEPGCKRYDVCRGLDNDHNVLLYEHYDTQAAFDAHRETEHFARLVEGRVLPLLVERERDLYELVESE